MSLGTQTNSESSGENEGRVPMKADNNLSLYNPDSFYMPAGYVKRIDKLGTR